MFYYYNVTYCTDYEDKSEDGIVCAEDFKNAIDKLYEDFDKDRLFKIRLEEMFTEGFTTISFDEIRAGAKQYGYEVKKIAPDGEGAQ